MAQYKYDLYTVPTEPKGPPRHHPWYKERLQLKFLKTSTQSAALNGARWISLAGDIDDFRSGVPAQTKGSEMVKKAQLNPVPLVDSRPSEMYVAWRKERRPQSKLLRCNPGIRTLYQKVGPRRQMQREHVGDVEANLLEHPLGLYPHLEEAIAPELLKDVVGIVDPDLKTSDSESELSSSTQSVVVPGGGHIFHKEQAGTPSSTAGDSTDTSAPCTQAVVYRWPLKQSEEEHKREQSLLASQQAISPTQESRVNHVTHDLVQWVRDLGGSDEQYSIDEATIKNLFGSDYETRSILTAPIHVVELVNVPEELRMESREHTVYSASSSVRPSTGEGEKWRDGRSRRRRRRVATFPGMVREVEELRCVRTRYGAWYLPVSLWRPRPWDEPLCDPRQEAAAAENEVARRNQAMDEMLAGLHGTHAFREFVVSRRPGANIPMFLKSLNADDTQKQTQSSTRRHTAAVS